MMLHVAVVPPNVVVAPLVVTVPDVVAPFVIVLPDAVTALLVTIVPTDVVITFLEVVRNL